ncbi:MAG: CoA transferase [Chloroflexi bacterium]|nr:CoA transferase [Chloroflexota bacterium]
MVQTEARVSTTPRALEGIRVLDFTWVRAGPWCTRWLGAMGAEVIKVEWPQSPNTRGGNIATGAGTPEGLPANLNTNGHFSDTNSNKLSITLNTRTERGIDLIKRLVSVSDIVIENFAYGVLERWGLGYEDMKKLRPDIIYLSMSGFGHTGRDRDYQTMGAIAQALSGMTYTSGLPGKPPAGWGWSYMDDTGGMYGAMYALSAIYHRNITGQGQHVDQSQWITGVPLNGASFLDIQANGRSTMREGYPAGNRAHWPGTPLVNNYRGRTVAPHNAYRTSPGEYNDWCTIACFSDDEWRRLVGVMGSPSWAVYDKFATLSGRLEHQEEMDRGIEAWTKTLGKYEVMKLCQEAGVPSMPVQSSQDRFENDPQLQHREMYIPVEHPALGTWPLQNAPFKMSETPVYNHQAGPLIGGSNKRVFEGLLGIGHEELVAGFEDGTFWPNNLDRSSYPYLQEMIEDASPVQWTGNKAGPNPGPAPVRAADGGAFNGLRVLELADEKGQWCGKLMADMGADVIKIEPPGGESARTVGPFYQDVPNRERSLYFWHHNTSKRGITLDIETEDGRRLFKQMVEKADVIFETFKPGYMASLGLGYEELKKNNPGLIMCSLTDFGQTGSWKDYLSSDLLHLAAGGQMARCGYDDVPDAPPIAPGGGQAWHMGSHFAYIAISAAMVSRSVTGRGQYIDASVHDACALTTEGHVNQYIYTGRVVPRRTGGGNAASGANPQVICKDGKYVNLNQVTPERVPMLAGWMDEYGLAGDLLDEKYKDPAVIAENQVHIREILVNFLANITRDEAYHGLQKRGYNTGAVRSPDEVMEDPHLEDRGFWTEVEYPEVGKSFRHTGPSAIFNGSPWSISRRAPLIGEHNEEVLCGELGLSRAELAVLMEGGCV